MKSVIIEILRVDFGYRFIMTSIPRAISKEIRILETKGAASQPAIPMSVINTSKGSIGKSLSKPENMKTRPKRTLNV